MIKDKTGWIRCSLREMILQLIQREGVICLNKSSYPTTEDSLHKNIQEKNSISVNNFTAILIIH